MFVPYTGPSDDGRRNLLGPLVHVEIYDCYSHDASMTTKSLQQETA